MSLWCLEHSLCEAQLSLFDKIHVHCLLSLKVCLQVVQLAKATAPVKFTYDHVSHSVLGALLATSKADSSGSKPPLSSIPSVAAVMHAHRSHLWVQVFGAVSTQAEVFAEAGLPLCRAVLEGFDGMPLSSSSLVHELLPTTIKAKCIMARCR